MKQLNPLARYYGAVILKEEGLYVTYFSDGEVRQFTNIKEAFEVTRIERFNRNF